MCARMVVAILAGLPAAFGQSVLGVTAEIGVPLADSFQTGAYDFLATGLQQGSSATRRYTAGAGLVLRLPRGFGFEFDVLYKRLGYDLNFTPQPAVPVVQEHTWTTANSWEFPLLGRYRLPRFASITPRILAGVSFRAVSGASTAGQCEPVASQYSQLCATTAPAQNPDPHLSARSSFGGTFGAGVEKRIGPLRLAPELRYTRWRADAGSSGSPFDLRSNPNQLDLLLGVTF